MYPSVTNYHFIDTVLNTTLFPTNPFKKLKTVYIKPKCNSGEAKFYTTVKKSVTVCNLILLSMRMRTDQKRHFTQGDVFI